MSRVLPSALLTAGLLVAGPAGAECEQPLHRADLALAVESAYQAFRQLDRQGFADARDGIQERLPCLAEPLQPADAAGIHGLMALSAFLDKDDGRSVASLHAAVRSDPAFDIPTDLFPAGHPLRLHLQVARSLQLGTKRPLPQPTEGAVTVDGSPAEHAPGDHPSVLQWTVDEIEVRDTTYLQRGAAMPDWGPIPSPVSSGREAPPWALVGASAGSAILAGSLAGLASWRHARFMDPSTPYEQLPGLRAQANGLTVAAGGAGAVAVGLGAVAVLRW
jgi:hypothetical protein